MAKEKRKRIRDRFLITGPTFAGKTLLYYKLMGGNISESVSSSDINESASTVHVRVPTRLLTVSSPDGVTPEHTFTQVEAQFVDVPGHFNFKKQVQVEASGAKAIVLLLDAKEKSKFSEAAEILYDLLGDIETVSQGIPILVACNKQDVPFAKNPL